MKWSDVGEWLKKNAGTGASVIGSLLTGNYAGAIAQGVSMVSGATGEADPEKALTILQEDPGSVLKLKEMYYQNEREIRAYHMQMVQNDIEDQQKEHATTQATIQGGDKAEDKLVRWTRPLQSWTSLAAAIAYAFSAAVPSEVVLGFLLTLPFAYFGMRQRGKNLQVEAATAAAIGRWKGGK